jgi:aspartyl-tRNA(Asn)/glutamyl-tRNA(Gln) amidotransferase subunit A
MTRTVRDAALMLQARAGPDERDLSSLPVDATAYPLACEKAVRGLRVAWSVDLGYAPVELEIAQICASAAQVFAADLGCVVEEAAPGFRDPVQSLQILWASGLAAALGQYLPQWGDQMDPGLVELIRSAEPLSATDYAAAVMERDALWNRVQHFFARYDLQRRTQRRSGRHRSEFRRGCQASAAV